MITKVKIDGIEYQVEEKENLYLEGDKCYGKIEYANQKILIDPKLGNQQSRAITLLHEIIHGIVVERGIDIDKLPNYEHITQQMAKGIWRVILDNPDLIVDILDCGFKTSTSSESLSEYKDW
jgi:hypothetical protein